jgi:hypothetical protein
MTEHDAPATTPPHVLAPGDPPLALTVDPRRRYVPTGIVVRAGERYRITATGTWRDASKLCGPEGWGGGWLKRRARLRGAALFALCGSIGRDDTHAFAIGRTLDWTVPASAAVGDDPVLCLFANDWHFMYWNNQPAAPSEGGPLRVTIERLP